MTATLTARNVIERLKKIRTDFPSSYGLANYLTKVKIKSMYFYILRTAKVKPAVIAGGRCTFLGIRSNFHFRIANLHNQVENYITENMIGSIHSETSDIIHDSETNKVPM